MGVASLSGAEPGPELNLERGKKVFETTCFVCHGNNGKGAIPGVPDLTRKDSRLLQDKEILVQHVLDGFQTPGNPLAMPPKGGNPTLSDAEVRDTVAYMRAQFLKRSKK